jgi:tRNA-dihydrouridine synthase
MAERFVAEAGYRIRALGAGGVRSFDHPLVVQFAANDPADFVEAALLAQVGLGAARWMPLLSNVTCMCTCT